MNNLKISILFTLVLIGCNRDENNNRGKEDINIEAENEKEIIPINYNFQNLNLYLNTSVSDSLSKKFWVWDHTAGNDGPDSIGLDYYMNYDQESFLFNSEESRPGLSIVTNKNIIIEFSATIVFHLLDNKKESIELLLNSLTTFDLLQNESAKREVLENLSFKRTENSVEESIKITLSEDGGFYDSITYTIKIRDNKS